jgi:hypothetical protein
MRFRINLASQPYENARRFFTQWGVALIALFIVSALLVFAAAKSWRVSHSLTRSVAEERARLDKLNTQEKADLVILNQEQNRDVRERAQAINALILRKQFSWTRIFSDLEKMVPTRLHVVAITPQLTPSDQIQIRMQVAGDSRDKAIELVQNMEKAPDFREAQILSETNVLKGTAGDTVIFEISALYVPSAAAAISEMEKKEPTASEPEAKGKTAEPRSPATDHASRKTAAPKGVRP